MQETLKQSLSERLKQKYIHPYSFTLKGIFKESWRLTKGAKGPLLLALFLYFLIAFGVDLLKTLVVMFSNTVVGIILQFILEILLLKPLLGGVLLLSVQRAAGATIKGMSMFSALNWFNILHLFVVFLWQMFLYIIVAIPLAGILLMTHTLSLTGEFNGNMLVLVSVITVAVIAVLYITTIYFMATPLIVTQRISGWQALTLSRLAVRQHFFQILWLDLVAFLILLVGGVFTLGIGFIWIFPWLYITQGRLFNTLFSLPQETHT